MILKNGKEFDIKSPENEKLMNEILDLYTDEISILKGDKKIINKALTISYCPSMVRPNDRNNPHGARSKGGVEKPASYSVPLYGVDEEGTAWRYADSKVFDQTPGGKGEDGFGFNYIGSRKEIKDIETQFTENNMEMILVAFKLGHIAPSLEEIGRGHIFYVMNKKLAKSKSMDHETVLAEMTLVVNKMDFEKLKNIAMTMQIPGASGITEAIDLKIMVKGWLQVDEKASMGKEAYKSVAKIKDFTKRAEEKAVTNNIANEDELSKAVSYLKDNKLITFYFKESQIFYKKTEEGQKEIILTYTKGQDPLGELMKYLAVNPDWAEKIINTYNLYLQEA